MDSRCIEPLLRFGPGEFTEASRRARRHEIALLRCGASAQELERARVFASMVRVFGRITEAARRLLENLKRTLARLLGSPPPRTMPYCAAYVLAVPMVSIPASPPMVSLSDAPHAPPAWRTTHSMR